MARVLLQRLLSQAGVYACLPAITKAILLPAARHSAAPDSDDTSTHCFYFKEI